jgi:SP family facilitated glucose transporter-like MFS transporter 8
MIVGRFLIGTAGGAYCFNIPVYVGETASKEIRGILLTFHQAFVRLGIVFVYVLGWAFDLFTLNAICGALVVIFSVGFAFLPEAPVFLVRQKKCEMAEKSIATLRGKDYDPRLEVYELQRAFEEACKAPKSSFKTEIRKRPTAKAFLIILCLFFVFQMSGINAVIFYATKIFIESGIKMDPFLATVILGVVEFFATMGSIFLVDKFGRVFLLITSFSMSFVGLMGIGSFFAVHANHEEFLTWLPLPSLCIFIIGFNLGMGTVPFVLLGEIFSHEAKKTIAPFAQTMQFTMSFVIGILYPALVNTVGTGFTFYIFAGFCLLGLIFTIFFIPETKNKSLGEIQKILEK